MYHRCNYNLCYAPWNLLHTHIANFATLLFPPCTGDYHSDSVNHVVGGGPIKYCEHNRNGYLRGRHYYSHYNEGLGFI